MAPFLLGNALLLIKPRINATIQPSLSSKDKHVAYKQLYLYDDTSALVSANPNYDPIILSKEIVIIGRVIKIERNLVNGWEP